jgi:D-glycero-alpha-D-manno-heptose 1-phosphate guanylyltransferase
MVGLGRSPQVAILAGGRGSRLRPLTDRIPKCLAPVAGRPFLAYVLEALAAQGIVRVLLCTGYLAELVERELGDGARFGLRINYSVERQPLGTVGALRQAAERLDEAFVLQYGDSYLTLPVNRFVAAARARAEPASMAVLPDRIAPGTGNATMADGRITAYVKGAGGADLRWVDYGMLALERRLLLEGDEPDEADLYARLAGRGQLAAYVWRDRFYEIGTKDSYREFCQLVERGELPWPW